jgi:succinate dehydrogenase flavin-adding protein (antitoxin of CptAB toxin-antitoxin module)
MTRLLTICQRFSTWKPALSKPSAADRILANQASKGLKLNGTHYVGPDGPFHVWFNLVKPLNDVVGDITVRTRERVGWEVWRGLREQMSERFVGHGFDGIVDSVPREQRDSFFGSNGNPWYLMSIVEDLLLTAFCIAHTEGAEARDAEVLADLLELFLRGIYPVGVAKGSNPEVSFLVLLHGTDPLLAESNP